MRAVHASKHKEHIINLTNCFKPSSHDNNDSIIDAICYYYLIITHYIMLISPPRSSSLIKSSIAVPPIANK